MPNNIWTTVAQSLKNCCLTNLNSHSFYVSNWVTLSREWKLKERGKKVKLQIWWPLGTIIIKQEAEIMHTWNERLSHPQFKYDIIQYMTLWWYIFFHYSSNMSLQHEEMEQGGLMVLAFCSLLSPSLTLKELMSLPLCIKRNHYVFMQIFKRIGGLIMSQPTMIISIEQVTCPLWLHTRVMTFSSIRRTGGLITSWLYHFVTILVNDIMTIWLPHQHSDLLIDQHVTIQKEVLHLHADFKRG